MDPALAVYPKYMKIVLLHECVHLKYPRFTHGKKFKAEIKRLFDAGAFDSLL